MRQVLDGNGSDSTTATQAWLNAHVDHWINHLFLIGDPESPYAHWLTDADRPLQWSLWGTFQPSTIKRGKVTSEFGLKVQKLEVNWSPPVGSFNNILATTSPYQKIRLGWYDNWPVRVWKVYQPVPGDANTYGASELFGGRVGEATLERGKLTFNINSFLDALNQPVPGAVIEAMNTIAPSRGAQPPAGFSVVPQFATAPSGSSTRLILGDCSNIGPHQIFAANAFQYGFIVFNDGVGATLARAWSAILNSKDVIVGGVHYNQFELYAPMPWAPTPAVDTFYVSAAYPINKVDGSYYGFPYVPAPESAI